MGIKVGRFELGGFDGFFLIAGPCVIEETARTMEIAERLAALGLKFGVPIIFKASFTKANRSSVGSYTGPGIDEGLEVLAKVKREFDIPVTSDVHCRNDVDAASQVLDLIQVPAFLSRQTELIRCAARTGKPLNIKKGQFMSSRQVRLAALKACSEGNRNVILTERGTFFGYGDLVVDMRNLVLMREGGFPVVYDATHSIQRPTGLGEVSGGDRDMITPLMRAAVAAGVDGIFFETHPEPEEALSDGPSMLPLDEARSFIEQALRIREASLACWRSEEAKKS
ncbi:MAG: 3-deoxy-8-phosphooctulonate synthase [Candidatus Glassbacteria bacterium]